MVTDAESLVHTSWRDDLWLQAHGLNLVNALDYFALSPFYDRSCNNEKLKLQGLPPNQLPVLAPGIEYVLRDAQPPHLFVICRQHRASPSSRETLQTVYYVLDGTVYQAPSLHAAVNSRLQRCRFALQEAFLAMQRDLHPLSGRGASDESDQDGDHALASLPAVPASAALDPEKLGKIEAAFRFAAAQQPLPVALREAQASGTAAAPPPPNDTEIEASADQHASAWETVGPQGGGGQPPQASQVGSRQMSGVR